MPVDDSCLSGFYRLDPEARRALLTHLSPEALEALSSGGGLDEASADRMIENVVGSLALPVGIATHFIIDGKQWLIPFAVEESSIIAAASNIAKRAASCGGFSTSCDEPLMIGQIQVLDVPSIPEATSVIQAEEASLIEFLNDIPSTMIQLGGGCKRIECRQVEDMLIVHLIVDVRDAMGANAVNTMAERIAPRIEALTGAAALELIAQRGQLLRGHVTGLEPLAQVAQLLRRELGRLSRLRLVRLRLGHGGVGGRGGLDFSPLP